MLKTKRHKKVCHKFLENKGIDVDCFKGTKKEFIKN